MTITKSDMERQVRATLDGQADQFDVAGIVDEIHEVYGLTDIENVDPTAFWRFVQAHAIQAWYFTFGVGHPLFSKKYVKINGTHEGARKIMFDVFGRNWSHQYDAAGKAQSIDRYGLTELAP